MVEFFDIPHIVSSGDIKKRSLYEWYCMTDYTQFNKKFKERFDDFEAFLNKCGITTSVNQVNPFMQRNNSHFEFPPIINQKEIDKLHRKLNVLSAPIKVIDKRNNNN